MTQQNFIRRREAAWKELEKIIGGGKEELKKHAPEFPQGFRELTQDLNTARAHGFDPAIIERLNRLVLEGNQILYGQRSWSLKGLADFILRTFPRTVRSQWRGLGATHLLFYGLAIFFTILCVRFPLAVYEILGPFQAIQLEEMYNPESVYFLTPRSVSSSADMFGYYIYNNISIAFRTFAGGILAGVGSIIILGVNGIILGVSSAHIINRGFSGSFFSFIIAHSAFELTAIILSGQAGLLLGYRLFVTRGLSRKASLKLAGKTALPLISGSALLLVIAATIEAFWSSRHELPQEIRYGAGILCWVLVLSYFLFAGRDSRKSLSGESFTENAGEKKTP